MQASLPTSVLDREKSAERMSTAQLFAQYPWQESPFIAADNVHSAVHSAANSVIDTPELQISWDVALLRERRVQVDKARLQYEMSAADSAARQAFTALVTESLAAWMAVISSGKRVQEQDWRRWREAASLFIVLLEYSLSFRDAVLVTLLDKHTDRSVEYYAAFALKPHDTHVAAALGDILRAAFQSPEARGDKRRVLRGLELLGALCLPETVQSTVQPLTMIAYVLWWMGEAHALVYAEQAYARSTASTLARIVMQAFERGVHPFWLQKHGQGWLWREILE